LLLLLVPAAATAPIIAALASFGLSDESPYSILRLLLPQIDTSSS
jgi:hypothetical protein